MRNGEKFKSLEEAELFSEKIIIGIKNIFFNVFSMDEAALYSWGSLARREMCVFSDIDIIILRENICSKRKINKFRKLLSINFPHNEIDLIQKYNEADLIKAAKIDGGDRQAVTLARFEFGSQKLRNKFDKAIYNDLTLKKDITKELLYIMMNLIKVYPKIFDKYDLKFCQYGSRYINFAFLYAKYIFGWKTAIYNTRTALRTLVNKKIISKKVYNSTLRALSDFINLRNIVQIATNKECNIWSNKYCHAELKNNRTKLSTEMLLKKDKSDVKLLSESLFIHIIKNIFCHLHRENRSLAHDLFFNYSSRLDKKVLSAKHDSDIMLMLLSYCTKNHLLLDYLYEANKDDWYISFGIANNVYSNFVTLNKLVNIKGKPKRILKLHNDFAWRNIYLYVARNKSTSEETLRFIINRKDSREMDVNAAKQNIFKINL